MAKEAWPLALRATGAPRLAVPFLNWTVPVGVRDPGATGRTWP